MAFYLCVFVCLSVSDHHQVINNPKARKIYHLYQSASSNVKMSAAIIIYSTRIPYKWMIQLIDEN